MREPFARFRRFFRELKRRNVYQVAVAYAVVGFVLIEAASLIFPALNIPSWAYSLVVVLVLFGFPIALVIAWAFEVTPEGVKRTPAADEPVEPASAGPATGGLPGWIVVLGIAGLAGGGVWYLTAASGGPPSGPTPAVTDSVEGETDGATRSASRDRPFVAVLPLENLSSEEENAFFADGIHEEVINQLSKVSGLRVRPRTSVRQYEGTEKTMQEIARELNVQALVEGSVRRAAGRVRISAQLFDARSGDPLWSDSYERELSPEALFEVQGDIAGQIAGAWVRSALELDSDDALTVMQLALTRALREPEQALTTMTAFLDRHPDHPAALFEAARYALLAGHPARTRSYLERLPEVPGPMGWLSWPEPMRFDVERRMLLGLAELRLGNRERGREFLAAAIDTLRRHVEQGGDTTGPLDVLLAGALAALEKREEAFRYLRPEAGERLVATAYLVQASPIVESLRSEPRYQELLRQVEVKHERFRDEVRRMEIDLYPSGSEADGTTGETWPSDG